jgi:DNA repair photolyase
MPAEYEEISCKRALGNLGVLSTRFWTRHCFDPYTNCELNCIYCGTSTVRHNDLETEYLPVCAKINAPEVLAEELAFLKKKGVVSIGLGMDAYQQIERKLGLTRQVLNVLKENNCPFAIGTKSDLILRDIDIISEAARKTPCCVSLSVTTLDEKLAKLLEPNASSPRRRLETVKRFSEAGVMTGVWLSPILPYITDSDENIISVIEAAVDNGAKFVLGGTLDMRSPVGVQRFLKSKYPHLVSKYNVLYRTDNGSYSYYPVESYLYDLYGRFISHCRKLGIEHYMPHFHTRKQALLFYIHNFVVEHPSISELAPLLNYVSPPQEILQQINLRFGRNSVGGNVLKTLRYFPH